MVFAPVPDKSVVRAVFDQLERRLADGTFKQGDRLPSERKLARSMCASRPAIREAVSQLAGRGLVTIEARRGVFVREPSSCGPGESLDHLVGNEITKIMELFEVRRELEVRAASLAAEFATEHDVAQLEESYEEFDRVFEDGTARDVADAEFHTRLAQAAGNTILRHILELLHHAIDRQPLMADLKQYETAHYIKVTRNQHRQIVDAVRSHNPDRAASLMAEHVDFVARHVNRTALKARNRPR